MASPTLPQQRYAVKEVLGKGGMGVVYRAYDNETKRDVTLKTLLDIHDSAILDLFRKECQVLSSMNHPNIVDVYDIGELHDEEGRKPYFVMPLLPGVTLDKLIASSSHRLTVERVVDIMAQACRGLQAAHERGLVHRDIKPSNIFVLEDDSVKIIDFGVAHLVESRTSTTLKGTLHYMAPEQIQMQKPTPLSDLFSLAVVCYECLARRRPFDGATVDETLNAILNVIPPPVSDFNPAVNRTLSQVVHKAMAKQSFHRFGSVREFGDNLQKALRGETIEIFNESRIVSRIQRAQKAFDSGEYDFASEVLSGLEAEGYLHPDMEPLRRRIDQAVRSKTIRQLLENARRCFKEEEYQLALQKVQEVFQIEPNNTDALTLKAEIENKRSTEQITQWLKLAQEHLQNHSYSHARQALEKVLQMKPSDSHARKMLAEVNLQEQEYVRLHKEKEELYYAAVEAWRKGEVSAALSELERVLDLDRRAPDTAAPDRAASYQKFYNQVRSDHDNIKNAYDEARKLLNEHNFKAALATCEEYLSKYPGHALFQSLKVDVEEQQRQELSAYIARIDREVEAEPDLDRRVSILREALEIHPKETHFERSLQLTTAKRDLVNQIVGKARGYEERSLYNEALGQWEMLRTIYALYPGLNFEIERVMKRREQQSRSEAKARWVEQIDRSLNLGEWQRALDLTETALGEFHEDAELKALEQLARQGLDRTAEAQRLLEQGRDMCASGRVEEGLTTLRRAYELDERNGSIRAALIEALLRQARATLDSDWHAADQLTRQALDLEPSNALAKSLRTLLEDRRRAEFVDKCLASARQKQAGGDLMAAIGQVEDGLKTYPNEARLLKVKSALEHSMSEQQRAQARRRDLEQARVMVKDAEKAGDPGELRTMLEQSVVIAKKYAGDRDFESIVSFLQQRLATVGTEQKPVEKPPAPAPVPPPGAQVSESATAMMETAGIGQAKPAEAPKAAAGRPAAPAQAQPAAPAKAPAVKTPPKPPASKPAAAARPGPPRNMLLIGGGAAVATLIIAFGAYKFFAGPKAPPTYSVTIKSDPSGATVRVDNQDGGPSPFSRALTAGEHTVSISLDGYEPVDQKINVVADRPCCDLFQLQALPPVFRLWTDLSADKITVDGQEKTAPEQGQPLEISGLTPGDHTLSLNAKRIEAQIAFHTALGGTPTVTPVTAPKDVDIFVLTTLGGRGRFVPSKPVKISWDGQNFQDAGTDGVDVQGLKPGNMTLTIDLGDSKLRNETVTVGPAPTVTAYIYSDQPAVQAGAILIQSNEPDFRVLIDGKRFSYRKVRSGFIVYNVNAGKHTVQLDKPGFRADPASHSVELAANQTAQIAFNMVALPLELAIRGALKGTQVFVGGRSLGTVGADGSLDISDVTAGQQTVELRKRGWRTRAISMTLQPGGSNTIDAPQSVLDRITGTIAFLPKEPKTGMTVRIEASQGVIEPDPPKVLAEIPPKVVLPAGVYNLTFSAPGYAPETDTVTVADHGNVSIDVTLKKTRK